MLDLKFVRENPEAVKQNIRNKFQDSKLPLVDEVIELDELNRAAKQEGDALRAERNLSLIHILEEAAALAALIKDQQGHVNLIPVNPIKERDYVQSDRKAIESFKNLLEKNGINVTIRREMGRDINGACGQLRNCLLYTSRCV